MELFHKILKACVDAHASDIHAKVGHPTIFRISRQLVAIDAPSPTPEWFANVLSHIVPDHLKEALAAEGGDRRQGQLAPGGELAVVRAREQVHEVVRQAHRLGVGVLGQMADLVLHEASSPVEPSCRDSAAWLR